MLQLATSHYPIIAVREEKGAYRRHGLDSEQFPGGGLLAAQVPDKKGAVEIRGPRERRLHRGEVILLVVVPSN